MKYVKTYEDTEYDEYKIGYYIIWYGDLDWEICKISSKVNLHTIKVLDLFCLSNNILEKQKREILSDIDLGTEEERESIKYISDDLEDCKEKIMILSTANDFNI